MAFTGITATEAEIDQKSGANVSLAFTDTMKTASLLQAESFVNSLIRFNFSDNYSTLNVDVKYIITMVTASMVAMDAINYDMGDYNSRAEAETMLDVLDGNIQKGLSLLKDKQRETFINGA